MGSFTNSNSTDRGTNREVPLYNGSKTGKEKMGDKV